MNLPLLWIALAAGLGILLPGSAPLAPKVWLSLAAIAILAGLAFARRGQLYPAWTCALAAWFLLGTLASRLERVSVPTENVLRLVGAGRLDISQPLRWTGALRANPQRLPWGVRYEIELAEVESGGHPLPVEGGLRLSYYRTGTAAARPIALQAGDRVQVLARAHVARNFQDPGAFDARAFLARQRVDLTGTLRDTELLQQLPGRLPGLSYRLARIRGMLLDRLDALFPTQRAAVLRAMLLGDRSFVDSDLLAVFQKSAAYHVLVIAGLHVGALAVFVFWLGRRLRLSVTLTGLITLFVLLAYVAVVEDRPPILRAALMAAAVLGARLLFRRDSSINCVALAALLMLLARPSELTDASFQLSFLAAGSIAALGLPWISRTSEPYRRGVGHLSDITRDSIHSPAVTQFRLDLRALARWLEARLPAVLRSRAGQWVATACSAGLRLWEIAVLSAAIQLALLPLLVLDFHRVSLSGPLANIPAVLLAGLIVPLGFLTLLFGSLSSFLAAALAKLLGPLVGALIATISWFGGWSWASYRIPVPPGWVLTAFFAVLVLLAIAGMAVAHDPPLPPARRWERLLMAPLAVLVVVIASYPFAPRLLQGKLEVTVLDVGQGDSLFVAFPGGRTMLIDGGGAAGAFRVGGYRTGPDIGEEVVAPYLWSRGLKRLDVVALTHAHHDHMDGLNSILDDFRVDQLWVGRDVGSTAYQALLQRARARGVTLVHRMRGASFDWGGVAGEVLWPPDTTTMPAATNNDSLVLRLQDAAVSFLLAGDVEQAVEKQLDFDGDSLTAAFLKVPHHGSRTSSTPEFLARVAPQLAVISVGAENPFGQPNAQVVERYRAAGVSLYRTDRDGAVSVITDGRTTEVSTFAQPPR